MIRTFTISLFILFLFGNCKKHVEEVNVSYKVTEYSVDSPSYTITYTSDKTGATMQANSVSDTWNSGGIILNKGEFISFTVDCTAPLYDFKLSIYANGNLWKQTTLQSPTGSATISGTLDFY